MRALDLIAVGQHGRGRVVAFRGSFRGYRSTVDIYLRTTRQQEIVLKLKQSFFKKKEPTALFPGFLDARISSDVYKKDPSWHETVQRHDLGQFLPLLISIEEHLTLCPLSLDDLSMSLTSRRDLGREWTRLYQETLREVARIRDDLIPTRVHLFLTIKRPQQPGNPKKQRPVRDMHALADPPARAEDEVVAPARVGGSASPRRTSGRRRRSARGRRRGGGAWRETLYLIRRQLRSITSWPRDYR